MSKVTKVIIEISTTNAAFDGENLEYELRDVLAEVQFVDGWKLTDSNGNTCGTLKVETE